MTLFLGTDTTVISAIKNSRFGIGIELTDKYFALSSSEIEKAVNLVVQPNYKIYKGDCEIMLDNFTDETIQLTFTSPPYADLIHKVVEDRVKRHKHSAFVEENNATTNIYSENQYDLGNMPMELYIEKVIRIMNKLG